MYFIAENKIKTLLKRKQDPLSSFTTHPPSYAVRICPKLFPLFVSTQFLRKIQFFHNNK
ncbi:hypothetical protein PAHAL_5G512000 [Panicum hallii]|uniref:Uncharacterized protein n=1 Tax=Panicum hallii TaxID=206008 RepID=A0A2T8IPB1_9POAL|nr:hypothetical protein PAHAL_5G512000 [Panicum hallii]